MNYDAVVQIYKDLLKDFKSVKPDDDLFESCENYKMVAMGALSLIRQILISEENS